MPADPVAAVRAAAFAGASASTAAPVDARAAHFAALAVRVKDARAAARDAKAARRAKYHATKATKTARGSLSATPAPGAPRVLTLAELGAGCGGGLYAVHAALAQLRERHGINAALHVAHASDSCSEKVALYNAGAAALGVSARAVVGDVRDQEFFSAQRVGAWAKDLDVLVTCVVCRTLSSARGGKRTGLLGVIDYLYGLLRVIALAQPQICLIECVESIEPDKLFYPCIVWPLEAMGYKLSWGARAGGDYSDAARDRFYMTAVRVDSHWLWVAAPPDRRSLKLRDALLAPRRAARGAQARPTGVLHVLRSRSVAAPDAPREVVPPWAYVGRTTIALREIFRALPPSSAMNPLGRSAVVNYLFNRVNQRKGLMCPTLTHSQSSEWFLRDGGGIRRAVALEVGRLHGYGDNITRAMVKAARSTRSGAGADAVADGVVKFAFGDGFMLPTVMSILLPLLLRQLRGAARTQATGGGGRAVEQDDGPPRKRVRV